MNTQILEGWVLRQKFTHLFVRGMNERVNYYLQFSYFYSLFVFLPLFIMSVLVLLSLNGISTKTFVVVSFAVYGWLYLYGLISLIIEDVSKTADCLWEIDFDYPEIAHALRITASTQWEDESTFCTV